jgi:PAS domain S-box-containing protein
MTDINTINVLLIDDDEDEFVIVKDLFSEIDTFITFSLSWQKDFDEAMEQMLREEYDVYLIDYRLGPKTGLDLIREVRKKGLIAPMILLTGQGDRKIDFEAMKLGASDYLVKTEVSANTLARSIRYAITNSRNLKELRTKETKYRSLFERSVDAIYLVDRNFRVIDLNESFTELLGYSEEELKAIPLENIFRDSDSFSEYQIRLRDNNQVRDVEVELCTKSGLVKDCLLNGVALKDNKGLIYGYQGIIHDLSLRKRAEQELLIAEKLAMTGNIARSIAHEVRNPLTNLNLALEQLGDELDGYEDSEFYLDIIQRNANRIDQLITEMLKSSKPKELHLKKYNINKIMEEVLEMTEDRMKLRSIHLELSFDTSIPSIEIDPEQMKTAILNIIINAIESMEDRENGKLQVATSFLDGRASVKITDNGKGIPKEEIRKLFDPFFTGKPGGMGLGLTSAQNIINSHKGKVDVSSEVGVGTTFDLSFPTN